MSARPGRSNVDPVDLIERDFFASAVVKLGGVWGLLRGMTGAFSILPPASPLPPAAATSLK